MPTKSNTQLCVLFMLLLSVDRYDAFTIYVTKCVIVGLVSVINVHIHSIKYLTITINITAAAAAATVTTA